jgi:hypothetical protein
MKKLKLQTALNQIKEGRLECIQDLKIGYVEFRITSSNKRKIIEIIK